MCAQRKALATVTDLSRVNVSSFSGQIFLGNISYHFSSFWQHMDSGYMRSK